MAAYNNMDLFKMDQILSLKQNYITLLFGSFAIGNMIVQK